MKRVVHQKAMILPFIASVVAKRGLLAVRFRALLRVVHEPSARAKLQALRRDVGQLLCLSPLFVARDRESFFEASNRALMSNASQRCSDILQTHKDSAFHLRRFCLCCNETTPMLVDHESGCVEEDGSRTPNWRERLICSHCGMNNRQRLVAKLVQQATSQSTRSRIYLMEQVTPIFEWVRNLHGTDVHGSEYLGYEYTGGERMNGIRHEDVMNLSFPNASFDLIVSNDVLEHIPDPERALRECFRVLKPGGTVLATFPFHAANDTTRVRARLVGSSIEHLLPPQYHGNPVSSDGSLVFQDFGWDLLDLMRSAGFSPAACEVYVSDEFGHLGTGLLVFRMSKGESVPTA
jgi:SAM-dependent methyltransferase